MFKWFWTIFSLGAPDNLNWKIVQLSYIERFKENVVEEKKA